MNQFGWPVLIQYQKEESKDQYPDFPLKGPTMKWLAEKLFGSTYVDEEPKENFNESESQKETNQSELSSLTPVNQSEI